MSIKPRELVNRTWSDPMRAPNLYYMTLQHELIVALVQESILNEANCINRRANVLDLFIRICFELSSNGNFHGSHAIYSAINMSSIHRLKQTFASLSKATLKKMDNLRHLFNYRNGRMNLRNRIEEFLSLSEKACIPELALLRKDLTFIEDGNLSKMDGMINFFKCQLLAKVIEKIKMHQNQNQNAQKQKIDPVALQFIKMKLAKWKKIFDANEDKTQQSVWENFRKISQEIE